jgi:hypothetical protein
MEVVLLAAEMIISTLFSRGLFPIFTKGADINLTFHAHDVSVCSIEPRWRSRFGK